jgi:opacity protein-like surface antigen
MKQLIIISFTALAMFQCIAQTDSLHNTKATETVKSKSTLTAGLTYSNNADYYGQAALDRLPYLAAAATYRMKCGIYFSGLAYRLLNDAQNQISASNLGAGINIKLSEKLSADLGYNHTFYPSYSPFLQAGNPDNTSVALNYENWLSTNATVDYAFGKSQDVFVTIGVGKMISLGSIGKKDVVTLTPTIDVVGGTQHFYQTYITEKKLEDSLLGVLFPPLFGNDPPGSSTFTKTITTFNLLSYNLKVPLAYNRANYLLEAQYQVSLLSNQAETGAGKVNSFLSVSFYYQF